MAGAARHAAGCEVMFLVESVGQSCRFRYIVWVIAAFGARLAIGQGRDTSVAPVGAWSCGRLAAMMPVARGHSGAKPLAKPIYADQFLDAWRRMAYDELRVYLTRRGPVPPSSEREENAGER